MSRSVRFRSWLPVLAGMATVASGQEGTLRPADLPVERFAQLPLISAPTLSPDGSHIAYFRPVDGRRYLVIQKLFSSDPAGVVPPTDILDFNWVEWASNEYLVFSMSYADKRYLTETTETRLLSVRADGSGLTPIVKPALRKRTGSRLANVELPPAQIQDQVVDWLPDEPHHILVALDEDQDARSEIRKIDIRSGDFEVHTEGMHGVQYWIADHEHVVRVGHGWANTEYTVILRSPDGHWQNATGSPWWEAGIRPVAFADDAVLAYALGPDKRGFDVLHTLDLQGGAPVETIFRHEEFDVGSVLRDRIAGKVTGVSYVDDFERHHYIDAELARLQASLDKAFPDTVNHIVSMSDDRRRLLVHMFSDVESGVLQFWDRDRGSVDFIAAIRQGLPPEALAPVRPVRYEARDGLEIPAYLTLPRNRPEGPLPAVILPHGGPAARSDRSFHFIVQFLASRGYAVLQPNFRGSSGYGADFQEAGRHEWGGKMQDDVSDGARWLVAEGVADPERLCIVGWSYGGYAAAMGAVKTPELYRCAASINGVLNLPYLLQDVKQYVGGRAWVQHIGLREASARDVSPYHQAERIQAPLLIIQATDDTRVHNNQGESMHRRLQRLDKPVEYIQVEFGGHGMDNEAARLVILTALERFLADNIGAAP